MAGGRAGGCPLTYFHVLGHSAPTLAGVDITWFILAIWVLMLFVMSIAVYFMFVMLRRSKLMTDPSLMAEKRYASGDITKSELEEIKTTLSHN